MQWSKKTKRIIWVVVMLVMIVVFTSTLQSTLALTSKENEGNAVDHYEKAFLLMKDFPSDNIKNEIFQIIENGWKKEHKVLQEFLLDNSEAFEEFRKGVKKNRCNFVKGETLSLDTPLPHLTKSRHLARLLVLESRLYEYKGDSEKVLQNYLDVIKFGSHVGQDKILISKLVEIAIKHMVYSALIDYTNCLEDVNTNRYLLDKLIALREKTIPIWKAFETEKEIYKNNMEHIFKGAFFKANINISKLDSDTVKKLATRGITNYERMLIESNKVADRYFDKFIEATKERDYPRLMELDKNVQAKREFGTEQFSSKVTEIFAGIKNKDKIGDEVINSMEKTYVLVSQKISEIMLGMLLPALTKAVNQYDRGQIEALVLETKLALNIYKKKNGVFPQSLDEIVPNILSEKPMDPFSSSPLKYKIVENGYVIYSVGFDLVDDDAKVESKGSDKGDIIYRYP